MRCTFIKANTHIVFFFCPTRKRLANDVMKPKSNERKKSKESETLAPEQSHALNEAFRRNRAKRRKTPKIVNEERT
jgi:hypothetical protein